jgi:hypothetical protein
MSARTRTAAALALGILASTGLKAAPLPRFALTAQTEHFSFYTRDKQTVEARKTEEYFAKVEELFGEQRSGRADYYRYGSAEEIEFATGRYAAGLTFASSGPGQIHSMKAFHPHEIVHLVAEHLGDPGAFFQEGLAVAIGDEARWGGRNVDAIAQDMLKAGRITNLSTLVAQFDRMDAQRAYPAAGSFVAFLLKTQGMAKMTQFFRSCSGGNTADAFQRAFGLTMNEAGVGWVVTIT